MMVSEKMAIIGKHQKSAPVQTIPIAHDFGLKVYDMSGWSDDVSGMIRRDEEKGGESGFAIFVNARHGEPRRRFTIAHEIAHFVLHKNVIGDGIQDDALYRSGLGSRIEAEANDLAADILMPRLLILKEVNSGKKTVSELAKAFNVSEIAMSIRLGVVS